MAKKHAACIDPSGDLIQWGHGFNGLINFIENAPQLEDSSILSTSPVSPAKRDIIISGFEGPEYINRSPEPTIVGHNLVLVATTKEHIIAVNDEQKLFISDGVREKPWLKKSPSISCDSIESSSAPSGAFGWIKNWLFTASSKPFVADTVQIVDLPFLSKTEKIVQLVSGDHHVVLLSNHGNVFTMAIDTHSNMFGQLGYDSLKSKDSDLDALVLFKVPSPAQQLTTGEMIQNAIEASDSLLRPNPKKLKGQEPQRIKWRDSIAELDGSTAERLHRPLFCKVDLGNKIAEIAAGTHHTLLRTASGQVWGFGANGYGQLGKLLGVVNMTPIVVNAPFSTPITGIWAGGDTSAFLTESSPGNLAECYTTGAGMWGQLGNNSFRQCQFEMVPVTDISRLSYYNESTGRISPIALNSLSIGRTHLAATMQTRVDNDGVLPRFGFNVFTWGSNHAFQLGNGKRAMASKPIQPDALPVIQDEFTKDGIQEHERATPSDQKAVKNM
ncbi:hypothetical protein DI09_92p70 [Mitosporidium daphniae]|uniref:Uncharacterized protein n=1 Tax=Mitosporidium daphniae TaxID=1485682 RepID=A0A098VMJ8_9MICR|nr:uncharacterized protein DI09_92p70 [Mitosporidium daphniae]KGG50034.1 hypothetical protein DI09_92p70 [Mitosporidium daphniae]|eukprot:XP_013236470.1 uncharacterized protein DI09_92p70 [Mitosporidium daphniae]